VETHRSAVQEWRQFWPLPVTAALGCSTAGLVTFGLGPFIGSLQQEFGWSRASISAGVTILGLAGAVFGIPVGMLVDRIGPRRLALTGVLLMPAAIAMLGTATGSLTNWYALWVLVACAALFLQPTIWTSSIASRFDASLGFALAFTLAGHSFSAAILPVLATSLILALDWRSAFMAIGLIWVVAVFPLMFLFFRSAKDDVRKVEKGSRAASELPGASFAEALRSAAFYKLILSSGFFAFTGMGTVVHFVPILTGYGASPLGAAGIASILGIFSFIGRLSTGLLLDRFSGRLVGAGAFALPVLACLLLLFYGTSPATQSVASALFGFAVGAEVDVIAYLVSKHFGLRKYGVIFGSVVAALAVGGALGPLAAGSAFDIYGGYTQFLMLAAVLMGVGSLAIGTLKRA
jgi:predicted MFS family arabinose efflux permease